MGPEYVGHGSASTDDRHGALVEICKRQKRAAHHSGDAHVMHELGLPGDQCGKIETTH
jgi:hypothetical protein